MKEAIYAASLDPITYGHKNLVERALKVFDRILVAIGINEVKKPLFSLKEREAMARKELAEFGNKVQVMSFNGMLSDFAYENNISTIIRGARSTPDFDYEKLLGDINRYSGVDTIIYTSTPELSHISSSAAKAITMNAGKNILDYVSVDIKRRLEEELLHQCRIGVTGMIGSGKSWIVDNFLSYITVSQIYSIECHSIDMDSIGHYILSTGKEPVYCEIRKEVNELINVKDTRKPIDIKKLRKVIFNNRDIRNYFDTIMLEPMMHELRKLLLEYRGTAERKSLVFVQGALLCEKEGLSEINNNLVLVKCPGATIRNRLKEDRGYSDEVIESRMSSQMSFTDKALMAESVIKRANSGKIFVIENDLQEFSGFNKSEDYESILKYLGLRS